MAYSFRVPFPRVSGELERVDPSLKRAGEQFDRNFDELARLTDPALSSNSAHLLVMSVPDDSIANGGDYAAFNRTLAQHGFGTVSGADQQWTHPVSGVYVLMYEHAWDTYDGGGTIQFELDGVIPAHGMIAQGSTGRVGQGSIVYYADADAVGKIKVTQSSGAAQTCSSTVRIALPDPVASGSDGFLGVRLFIDDALVAQTSGDVGTAFSDATVLLGETSTGTSLMYYDQAHLYQTASNLLANSGFESTMSAWSPPADVTGNWATYAESTGATAQSSAQAKAGTYSASVNAVGDVAYVIQDVTMTNGVSFELDVWVYPSTLGSQQASVLFGWDKVSAAPTSAKVSFTPSATSFTAFGLTGSGPALPTGQWSHVVLQVVT